MSSEDVRSNQSIQSDLDFGLEYELEENVSLSSRASHAESPGMPRFEEYRHPQVKLFVVVVGLLSNVAMLVQSLRHGPLLYSNVMCALFGFDDCVEKEPTFSAYFEFALRTVLEFVLPLSFFFTFVFLELTIRLVPATAFRFTNPIPSLVPLIAIVFFLYSITSFLSSIALLPSLATTSSSSVWLEYLRSTGLGLFWMFSLLNIFAFSQLTIYDFIRAQEKHQMRGVGLEDDP